MENPKIPGIIGLVRQKKNLIFIILLIILLISIPYYLFTRSNQNGTSEKITSDIKDAPRFEAQDYSDFSNIGNSNQTSQQSAKIYTLRENFTLEEALSLAGRVGLKDHNESTGSIVFSNLDEKNSMGIMQFNTLSGAFTFTSGGRLTPSIVKQYPNYKAKPQEVALSMIKDLGIYDDTITCPITYKRTLSSDLTFIECHRDWNALGAPLVNLAGLLNLPEQLTLSRLSVGKTNEFTPPDETVINTNTKEDGKARLTDFNTITVGVYTDGRIHSVASTMRLLTKNTSTTSIISAKEALALVKEGKADFSFSIPAGVGQTDWDKVYQDNKAVTEKANVSDTMLVYLEKPSSESQKEYKPYYIFRGSAVLNTGYSVRFIQAIEASTTAKRVGKKFDFKSFFANALENTKNSVIKQACAVEACEPSPTPLPIEPPTSFCPSTNGFISKGIALTIPGYGTLYVQTTPDNPHTFFMTGTSGSSDMKDVKEAFLKAVQKQFLILVARDAKNNPAILSTELSSKSLTTLYLTRIYGLPAPDESGGRDPFKQEMYADPNFTSNLADEILKHIENNTLLPMANEPDLFPGETLQSFAAVLITIEGFANNPDSCYISGMSPAIFLYNTDHAQITTPKTATYIDPPTKDRIWNVLINNNTLNVNGVLRNYLYYEYNADVSLLHPQEGFIIKTTSWDTFIKRILASKIGLNDTETTQLVREVANVLNTMKSKQYLKISLADENELNSKIPLTINPLPNNIYRIHLLLTPLDNKEDITEPSIRSIVRDGFTVVELGAR